MTTWLNTPIQMQFLVIDDDPADTMMAVHGYLGHPCTLWTAAQPIFEQSQGASS